MILPYEVIRRIVSAAYMVSENLGLLVETAAVTGARYSQIARMRVGDLQDDNTSPRLMMPSSRKAKGTKKVRYCGVPIGPSLARKLRCAATGQPSDRALLVEPGGEP